MILINCVQSTHTQDKTWFKVFFIKNIHCICGISTFSQHLYLYPYRTLLIINDYGLHGKMLVIALWVPGYYHVVTFTYSVPLAGHIMFRCWNKFVVLLLLVLRVFTKFAGLFHIRPYKTEPFPYHQNVNRLQTFVISAGVSVTAEEALISIFAIQAFFPHC